MDAVGRLAGGVAHDFNTLLTVIDAHAEFALNANEGEATRREDIESIRHASARAAELTRQLLAFSRKQPVAPVPIELSRAVANVANMLGESAKSACCAPCDSPVGITALLARRSRTTLHAQSS
jgi:two-component system, cell cycle sensor histidine kinase and response regulator CckA